MFFIINWTGEHLQVILVSINVCDDIGLEVHPNVDQFIHIEEGQGLVKMERNNLKVMGMVIFDREFE